VLDYRIADRLDDIHTIAGYVDPAARAWLEDISHADGTLASKPTKRSHERKDR